MKFSKLQSMVSQALCVIVAGLLVGLSTIKASDVDIISFTQPLYHGEVLEKAVSAVVESDVMMGMWLTDATRNVRFDIDGENHGFQASKRILGNFVFLELRTESVSQSRDVRIRALSPDFNQETFCTVRVHVKDVNDFQPLFTQTSYEVSINEDTKVGSVISHVKATDLDHDLENKKFYYSLADYTSDYFAVHPITGAVFLTAPLNAKTQSSHSVAIQATDRRAALAGNAKPKRISLTVTVEPVNAHAPEIIVHRISPLDDDGSSQRGRQVYATLKVVDKDLGVNGQTGIPLVTHCDVPELLIVEPRGSNEYQLVFTRNPPRTNTVINVTVQVSDSGTPPRTTRKIIQIHLFDKSSLVPTFTNDDSTMVVSEISPIATQVGFVNAELVYSNLPSNIQYSVLSGNEAGYFNINTESAMVTTAKRLDRNSGEIYRLTIAAVNTNAVDFVAQNTTVVNILIEDANNHDPTFNEGKYMARILENAPVGSVVTRVGAEDEDKGMNGTVVYSLINSASLPFAIDSFNGTIYTTALIDSDIFGRTTFDLRVRASDRGLPFNRKSECIASVHIVNINDNSPVFNEVDCALIVPITTAENTTILQLDAIDIDRNPFTCKLLEGGDGWFRVTPKTCELQLADDLTNTENGRHFTLFVTAHDGQHTSESMVVNVTMSSNQRVISKVCRDTGAIRRLEESSMNNLQLSNSQSGANGDGSNLGSTSRLPNKNRPKILSHFSRPVHVSEDLKLQSVVTRIQASDKDTGYNGKLWYTITTGNDESCFVINTQTGFIYLARSLDRERRSSYNLTVKVSDLGTPSRSTVARIKIVVTDVNDNAPVFARSLYTYEIPEDVAVGYLIQSRIEARDRDAPINARVRYKFSPHSVGIDSFFINPLTGFINITKGLDRESVAAYNLTVIATDSAPANPQTSTTTVFIRLLDVNDNAPKFYQPLYRIQIAEDLPVHTVVFWLKAHDADEGDNGVIRYSLTDGVSNQNDAISRFHVDDRTGAIRLSGSLDSRIQNRYNITARARDSKQSYSTCYIEVEVIPVNRNLHAPYFANLRTRFEVSENVEIGENIGTVSAVDEDVTNPERDIGYYIVDGTGLGVFGVDQNTGTITTLRSLDREAEQYYWITVLAKDRAAVPLSGHLFVLIEVTDVNDNAPLPSQPMYFASVLENSPIGTVVTKIEATDKDSGDGRNITYTMSTNKYFEINEVTGAVTTRVKKPLNRESIDISQLSFEVTISDGFPRPRFSRVPVIVNVSDQNDNSPKFYKSMKKIVLPTRNRTRVATPIARIVAFDSDAGLNADIDYVLDRSQKFTINPKYGIISTNKAFKAGQMSTIKISAYDLGSRQKSEKTRLQIEWQEPVWSRNPPEFVDSDANLLDGVYFEHVEVGYVTDEMHVGRTIGLLQATDVDSDQLWFSIVAGNDDNMFDIDGSNALYVAGEPDAETKDFYNLTIEVTDGYNKAYKQVAVPIGDINDNRPEFSEKVFYGNIDESSPANKRVIQLTVLDGDRTPRNRNFIFQFREFVNPSNDFRIVSDGTIYTNRQFDRETQREYILFVEVDDQGVPGSLQAYCQVIITVTDKNEHAPQFTSSAYFGQISIGNPDSQIGANETQGEVVVQVRAADQDFGENARISYSIDSGNAEGLWHINPSTGDITATSNLLGGSRSTDAVTSLVVTATDGGKPALASNTTVTIDIKSHSSAIPRFDSEEISTSIAENAPRGSFVTMITATASSGISYSFVSGNVGERFHLNPHSGVVSLADVLDREEKEVYHLVVSCISTDGMQASSRITVHVTDVNDNRPRFLSTSYIGYVSESNTARSNPVTDFKNHPLVVSAVDNDAGNNARIAFSIIDPDLKIDQRFAIDSDTGAIRAKTGIGLFDYETIKEYRFRVQCFDLGNPRLYSEREALITIHVRDANDTIPTFTQPQYNFNLFLPTAEGVVFSSGTYVSKPQLFQKVQSMLVYSISGDNENPAFQIDPETGVLSVFDPSNLSDGDVFNLRIRVTDGKHSSSAKVTVTVSNVSTEDGLAFTRNVYVTSVKENSTNVQDLIATHIAGMEIDDNIRFRILNPIPSLKIGGTSGVISTTGVSLDRETRTSHELLVEAVDVNERDSSGELFRRGRCKVRVNVTDINDSAPEFIKQTYYATVQVDAAPNSVVKQITAEDADQGANSVVSYTLEGKYSRMFDVDARTGLVTLRRTPDVNVDGGNVKFRVTVVARDMGTPSLVGKACLVVTVINRATPVFTQQFYGEIIVSEDAQPYTVVTDAVKAASPDGSDIYFTIEYGDPLQQFDIDFATGTITTRAILDHEQQAVYRLRVRARDAQSRAYANVEVEVSVTDVNDHAPVFDQSHYSIRLPESAAVGTTVVQVKATDQDSDNNGHLAYEIVDNELDDGGYFHIDQDTGMIWTARSLYSNKKKTLSFVVRASDYGAPVRHTDVMVALQIEDVNNNPPIFEKNVYEFEISNRAKSGLCVGKVLATDSDATDDSSLTYSIPSAQEHLPLNIDSTSGVISLIGDIRSSVRTNVTVTDGVYLSSASLVIRLATEDTSPTPVVFDQSMYSFSVEENKPVGSYVGRVSASGLGRLNYRIETETVYSDMFRLNSRSGRLQTAQIIDRESLLQHKNMDNIISITVTATDSKGSLARCEIKVKILDDNDNAPIFTLSKYLAVLVPSNRLKDSVLNISAFDSDFGENGRITYSWHDAPPAVTKVFSLDPDEGEIKIRDMLPFGTTDSLQFFVQASDHGSETVLTNVVPVSIHLTSDTASVPRFSAKSYSALVVEEEAVGTEVITVHANVGNNLKIAYALAESYVENEDGLTEAGQDQIPKFSVDAFSGRITTLSPLDREEKSTYEITVFAYVKTTPNLVASTKVFVTVLDTNDNAPVFTTDKYRASIVENSPINTAVIMVQATDIDKKQFGKITYRLQTPEDNSELLFEIDENTGVISTTAALDREVVSRYDLLVEARDGGETSEGANQMKISNCHLLVDVIDVNDSPPVFARSSYQATISEGVQTGHTIPSLVKVRDADTRENSNIRFHIIDGDAEGHFEMIWDSNSRSKNGASAGIKLLKNLDREAKSSYLLTILATDGLHNNTANLRVVVGDINDNTPICQQLSYYGSVSESLPPRSSVLRIHATDADVGENGRITYQLSGEGMETFTINPNSGELYTATTLDREITSQYQLTATASDGEGQNCQMQIVITVVDVNDNAPQLVASSLSASTKENTPVNSLIHRVNAKDNDAGVNGSFVFSFLDDADGQFYIEPTTGVVSLKKLLDRETISSYKLRVKVRDRGNMKRMTSTGTLSLKVLDINDNPPIFTQSQYEAEIPEDSSPGQFIIRVSAKSLDTGANAKLRYTISGGNEHGKFNVNENTGEVRLLSILDYETDQSYVLKISAADLSENPLSRECTLRLNVTDVNDNAPEFTSPYRESLPEDIDIGHLVVTVSATDRDSGSAGTITYSLSPSNDDGVPFRIDSVSGKLTVTSPGLDYEKNSFYRITVIASDSGIPQLHSESTIEIVVGDVNDNRPVFAVIAPPSVESKPDCSLDGVNCTVFVHESTIEAVTKGIVKLNATDRDGVENGGPFKFRIKQGNDNDLFYLDDNNILKARRPLELDTNNLLSNEPRQLVHRLIIEAKDDGKPVSLASNPDLSMYVIVLKENQYAPVMAPHYVQIATPFNQFEGDLITHKFHATDQDAFDQNHLHFSMASPADFERYVVDPLTGAVTSLSPLETGVHNVVVRVSDGNRYSNSTVSINVIHVGKKALENSVAITFSGINSVQEYMTSYHSIFVTKLSTILPLGVELNRDLVIMSLKTDEDSNVQLLFGIRNPSSKLKKDFYSSKSLKRFLETSRQLLMADGAELKVKSIEGTSCPSDDCAFGTCSQVPTLGSGFTVVSTNTYSLVTTTFVKEKACVCPPGTTGKFCDSICSDSNNPCSKNRVCVVSVDDELNGYRCDPAQSANTIMTFSGHSYARYTLDSSTNPSPFQVSMRLRTFQSNSTLFYAAGLRHFARLETTGGLLQFTFDCGGGPQTMRHDEKYVNDGKWVEVDVESRVDEESNSCAITMTIDGTYRAGTKALNGDSNLDVTSIHFGGMPLKTRGKRSVVPEHEKRDASRNRVVKHGFRGCMKEIKINDLPLLPTSKSSFRLDSKKNVLNRCTTKEINMGACNQLPCQNRGRCLPLPDGQHECECMDNYYGNSCENVDPCFNLPCNNGYCYNGQNTQCVCSTGYTGSRCEIKLPSCPVGWKGQHCDIDIDECEINKGIKQCGGKEKCFNYDGGFACNCKSQKVEDWDDACEKALRLETTTTEANASLPSWILIVAITGGTSLLIAAIVLIVCIRKRKRRKLETDSDDFDNSHCRAPPRVPPPPSSYLRSSRDSYMDSRRPEDQEQRNPLIGYVHPTPMSGASDSDSMRKPSPSWPDYDPTKLNESTTSSVQHFPNVQKTSSHSIADQQSYDWDVTDWKLKGSGVVPQSVARVAVGPDRVRGEELPSSPISQRSINSVSTCRSCRSNQRSDALAGHYNKGRVRGEKQIFQQCLLTGNNKPTTQTEAIELKQMISKIVSNTTSHMRNDSRSSSLRSASSRYRQEFQPMPHLQSSYSSSFQDPSFSVESHSIDVSDEYQQDELQMDDVAQLGVSPKNSDGGLPLPPSDYELQVLRGDDEDDLLDASHLPTTTNKSYSSLLNSPFNVDYPTPAVSRRIPFHSGQHLVDYFRNISDLSLAANEVVRDDQNVDHPNLHQNSSLKVDDVSKRLEETPSPPQRHDSERLAMSSLSDDEETEFLRKASRKKQRHGRPPLDPKAKARLAKKKSGAKAQTGPSYCPASNTQLKDHIFIDRPSPGTTDV